MGATEANLLRRALAELGEVPPHVAEAGQRIIRLAEEDRYAAARALARSLGTADLTPSAVRAWSQLVEREADSGELCARAAARVEANPGVEVALMDALELVRRALSIAPDSPRAKGLHLRFETLLANMRAERLVNQVARDLTWIATHPGDEMLSERWRAVWDQIAVVERMDPARELGPLRQRSRTIGGQLGLLEPRPRDPEVDRILRAVDELIAAPGARGYPGYEELVANRDSYVRLEVTGVEGPALEEAELDLREGLGLFNERVEQWRSQIATEQALWEERLRYSAGAIDDDLAQRGAQAARLLASMLEEAPFPPAPPLPPWIDEVADRWGRECRQRVSDALEALADLDSVHATAIRQRLRSSAAGVGPESLAGLFEESHALVRAQRADEAVRDVDRLVGEAAQLLSQSAPSALIQPRQSLAALVEHATATIRTDPASATEMGRSLRQEIDSYHSAFRAWHDSEASTARHLERALQEVLAAFRGLSLRAPSEIDGALVGLGMALQGPPGAALESAVNAAREVAARAELARFSAEKQRKDEREGLRSRLEIVLGVREALGVPADDDVREAEALVAGLRTGDLPLDRLGQIEGFVSALESRIEDKLSPAREHWLEVTAALRAIRVDESCPTEISSLIGDLPDQDPPENGLRLLDETSERAGLLDRVRCRLSKGQELAARANRLHGQVRDALADPWLEEEVADQYDRKECGDTAPLERMLTSARAAAAARDALARASAAQAASADPAVRLGELNAALERAHAAASSAREVHETEVRGARQAGQEILRRLVGAGADDVARARIEEVLAAELPGLPLPSRSFVAVVLKAIRSGESPPDSPTPQTRFPWKAAVAVAVGLVSIAGWVYYRPGNATPSSAESSAQSPSGGPEKTGWGKVSPSPRPDETGSGTVPPPPRPDETGSGTAPPPPPDPEAQRARARELVNRAKRARDLAIVERLANQALEQDPSNAHAQALLVELVFVPAQQRAAYGAAIRHFNRQEYAEACQECQRLLRAGDTAVIIRSRCNKIVEEIRFAIVCQ